MKKFSFDFGMEDCPLEYEYDASFGDLVDAVAEYMFDLYYEKQFEKGKYRCRYEYLEATKQFLKDNDWVIDEFAESYEDELKQYIYDAAWEEYRGNI